MTGMGDLIKIIIIIIITQYTMFEAIDGAGFFRLTADSLRKTHEFLF